MNIFLNTLFFTVLFLSVSFLPFQDGWEAYLGDKFSLVSRCISGLILFYLYMAYKTSRRSNVK